MAVRVGSARIDEYGNVTGGKPGDQKQTNSPDWSGEVSMQNWYLHSKGWYVIRANDASVREKIAYAMEAACNNKHIGYSQGARYTAQDWCKEHGQNYDPAKITADVAVDCSALVRLCCTYAGITVGDMYTGSMTSILEKTGKFTVIKDTSITNSSDYQMRGDILVTRSTGHTVVVLDNGAKISQQTPPPEEEWKAIGTATCTANSVNVRATPNGTILTQAGKGNRFEVDGKKSGDWVHIKILNTIGWMHSDYVAYDNASIGDNVIGKATAKTNMNVRAASNTNGKIYGVLSKGKTVDVLEILSNGWYKISWPAANAGYAYVSNANNAYFTYSASATSYVVEVTADSLYVRQGPDINSNIKGVVHKGERYTIVGVENTKWGKLYSGGYISLLYTKKV